MYPGSSTAARVVDITLRVTPTIVTHPLIATMHTGAMSYHELTEDVICLMAHYLKYAGESEGINYYYDDKAPISEFPDFILKMWNEQCEAAGVRTFIRFNNKDMFRVVVYAEDYNEWPIDFDASFIYKMKPSHKDYKKWMTFLHFIKMNGYQFYSQSNGDDEWIDSMLENEMMDADPSKEVLADIKALKRLYNSKKYQKFKNDIWNWSDFEYFDETAEKLLVLATCTPTLSYIGSSPIDDEEGLSWDYADVIYIDKMEQSQCEQYCQSHIESYGYLHRRAALFELNHTRIPKHTNIFRDVRTTLNNLKNLHHAIEYVKQYFLRQSES